LGRENDEVIRLASAREIGMDKWRFSLDEIENLNPVRIPSGLEVGIWRGYNRGVMGNSSLMMVVSR